MQRTSFNYSTNNIPVAPAKVHTKRLIEKEEQFLSRMRWEAFHYLNPVTAAEKETLAFKTRNCQPVVEEMKSFEEVFFYFFYEASAPYKEELRKSGFVFNLEFKPPLQQPPSQKRKRQRNVIWLNPPYNKSVKTNIAMN